MLSEPAVWGKLKKKVYRRPFKDERPYFSGSLSPPKAYNGYNVQKKKRTFHTPVLD
jgi:hypothetical protein